MRLWLIAVIALLPCLPISAPRAQEPAQRAAAEPSPVDDYIASTAPPWIDRAALATALKDAGDNWGELAGALTAVLPQAGSDCTAEDDRAQDNAYANMVWLVCGAPHLDRLELTQALLVDNMLLAVAAAHERGYDTQSDFYRRYVLNYRLDDEPVTDWRRELRARYMPAAEGGTNASAPAQITQIALRAAAGYNVRERGYFGNLAAPLAVDNARAGTKRELTLLVAATLRSQGFGTRFVRENRSGESWVEVYTGDAAVYAPGAWTPVYPTAPEQSGNADYARELCGGRIAVVTAGDAFGQEQVTARYSDTAALQVRFERSGEELKDYEHWSVAAWFSGDWVPLDDLGYPVGDMDYPLGEAPEGESGTWYYLGAPGEYRLTAGMRYPGGVAHVKTQEFTVQPGDKLKLELALDPPADLPAAAMVERQILSPLPEKWQALGSGAHLFIVTDSAEPSLRALELLKPYATRTDLSFTALAFDTADIEQQALLSEALLVAAEDVKPVVILTVDGTARVYSRGFNLSIADWVARALAD